MFTLNYRDKVKVQDDLSTGCGLDVVDAMLKYKGKLYNIYEHNNNNGRYYLTECEGVWAWTLEMFEYIQPQTLTIEMASNKDVVVNCRTKEDAEYFCKWLDFHGKKWITNQTYLNNTNWDKFKEDTCYSVKQGMYWDADLEHWNRSHDKEEKIIAIIRFTPSMIENDKIWGGHKAHKINVSESEKSNEIRVLMGHDHNIEDLNKKNIQQLNISNIKFNDKETIVDIGCKEIKVTCQNNDTYSKEQAIVQAIAKYCGYGTKKINELIEKFDVEEKFKPYLYYNSQKYGEIGKETDLLDVVGRKLRIGDLVEIWHDGKYLYDRLVAEDKNGCFVSGYGESKMINGIYNYFGSVYKIVLKRGFDKVLDNEVICGFKYVKSPSKTYTK